VSQAQVLAVERGHVGDLRRQFPSRRHHQRARSPPRLAVGEALEDGEQKRRGLARAGLGAGDQIATLERHRNGAFLNGGSSGVARPGYGADKFRAQAQFDKLHLYVLLQVPRSPRRGSVIDVSPSA